MAWKSRSHRVSQLLAIRLDTLAVIDFGRMPLLYLEIDRQVSILAIVPLAVEYNEYELELLFAYPYTIRTTNC